MSRPRDIMASTHSQHSQRNIGSNNVSSAPPRHSQLTAQDHVGLDWRYLSTTEAYSSEYSAASEEDDEPLQAMVAATAKESNILQSQRGLGSRPLLVASSPVASGLFATSPGTAHEADDSTDTIKSMRARALDKINGRKGSLSNMSSSYNNNSNNTINGLGSNKRATSTTATGQGTAYLHNRPSAPQDDKSAPREHSYSTSIKVKRRSFGQSTAERSPVPRISTKTSQQEPRHTTPATQQIHIRKRNSGSFKSQQVPMTSEDEEAPSKGNAQDRARHAAEGSGILVSELKALKARVQELEMERMNRSLSGFQVQSPQTMTPQSLEPPVLEDHQSLTHSEKLQHIIQKHRGSTQSLESFNPIRSPTRATSSESRQKTGRSSEVTLIGDTHLEPSAKIDSPQRNIPAPSTQHVDLLQGAFKTYEKTVSASGSTNAYAAVQTMSKVVSSVISMNQTIRTWIKADVTLVDSSSMSSLQRVCDEQIRNLTESLLAMVSMQSTDRNLAQSDSAPGRPYSPRPSGGSQKFVQGQRLSLAVVGSELGARTGTDYNLPYPTRPMSAAASNIYDPAGSVTPNAMSSSGYWTRTSSISSSTTTESRAARANKQGYMSDFSHDRQPSSNGLGPARHAHTGVISSRESSPPQENAQGQDQRRQVYASTFQNGLHSVESLRPSDSSQHRMTQSPSLEGSGADSSTQLARRQASVRNIMARYSQTGPRSPTFGQPSQDHGPAMGQSQYDGGPDPQRQYEERSLSTGPSAGQKHASDRRYHSPQRGQDISMSASVDFSSNGHTRASSSARRPLSQQDNHSYLGSGISTAPLVRQGSIIHRSGRYANDKVFSEDESIGGWGTTSLDQLPQRSKTGSYAVRLQQLRGRVDQMQPLHQQLEQFERNGNGQEQYIGNINQQQQHHQGDFSDGAESDMFADSRIPRFAQRRQPLAPQRQHSQQYQDIIDHQKHPQHQPLQLHQDMMMTTPSMPSPNSSPSSSSRLDAPSLASSNSHHGGLAGVDARYHLSPRGLADSSTFPRQMSMASIDSKSPVSIPTAAAAAAAVTASRWTVTSGAGASTTSFS
ncbi:hypothetical protein BGX27_003072 [Mortierella sp. AM989]|nr:hypothetical protein BGX27_003072 [Mortierella sp. AM989]